MAQTLLKHLVILITMESFGELRVTRSRAKTNDPVLEAPKPESKPEAYTQERLLEGIRYVNARLTRNPTPRTVKMLELYRQDCEAAITEQKTNAEGTIKLLLNEIRIKEIDISNSIWFREIPDAKQEKLEQDLLQLRRLVFHARYGDYFAALTKMLKKSAMEYKSENWRTLVSLNYMTDLSKKISQEKPQWDKVNIDTTKVPITYAIYLSTRHLGIQFEAMIDIIHLYADRNHIFHKGLDEALAQEDYADIAQWIDRDIKDLSSVIPMEFLDQEAGVQAALTALRSHWFDRQGSTNPKAWAATKHLREHAAKKKLDPEKAAREEAQRVAQMTQNLLAKNQEEAALLQQAATTPDPKKVPKEALKTHSAPAKKRKASTEMTNDRRSTWKAFYNQQVKAHESYEQTIATARAANDTLLDYRNEWGSSSPPSSSSPAKPTPKSPSTPGSISGLFDD